MNNRHLNIKGISDEERREFNELGFKEFKGRRVPDFCNPDTNTYWYYTGFLFTGCLFTRIIATNSKMPKFPATLGMVLLAFSSIWDRKKFDIRSNRNLSKNLQDNLDLSPMTRNAYKDALRTNILFQNKLKKEILLLENKLK